MRKYHAVTLAFTAVCCSGWLLPTSYPSPASGLVVPASQTGLSSANRPEGRPTIAFEHVGQLGGSIGASHVDGDTAFVGLGPRLVVVDFSEPTAPVELGRSTSLQGLVNGLDVSDGYAYATLGGGGLSVIRVSDPASPVAVGNVRFPAPALAVRVVGDIAYVAAGTAGLRVVSVSARSEPREIGSLDSGLYVTGLEIDGSFAYLAVWNDGMQIVSVADALRPVEIGRFEGPESGFAKAVKVVGEIAYLADGYGGLRVVSVADRSQPVEVSAVTYQSPGMDVPWQFYARGVDALGDYVYVGGQRRLWVFRMVDPADPLLIGTVPAPSNAGTPVQAVGGSVFVTGSDGIQAYSLAEPFRPAAQGIFEDVLLASSVRVHQDLAVVGHPDFADDEATGLRLISVADPSRPTATGFITTPAGLSTWPSSSFDVAGDYVYLAEGRSGLRVVSAADPNLPVDVGHLDAVSRSYFVRLYGRVAYVADRGTVSETLRVVSVANPAKPAAVADVPLTGQFTSMTKADDFVYLAGWGLSTVQVGSTDEPSEVDYIESEEEAHDVDVGSGYLYVSEHESIRVLSLEDPAHPDPAVAWDTEGMYLPLLTISDDVALSPRGPFGVGAYVIDEEMGPVRVGEYRTHGEAEDLAVEGDLVYVAAGAEGLLVLRKIAMPGPPDPASVLYLPSLAQPGA